MKFRSIFLLLMVFYDFSLHFVKFLNKVNLHPLYPTFPLIGFISYDLFWTVYYAIATILALTLLGSGTTVKTKNITNTHIHQDKEEIFRLNKKIEEFERNENGM